MPALSLLHSAVGGGTIFSISIQRPRWYALPFSAGNYALFNRLANKSARREESADSGEAAIAIPSVKA